MYDAIMKYFNKRTGEDFDSRARILGRMPAIARMAAIAEPYLSQEGVVSMDLGCGTGLFAEAVGVRSIIGVDFSSALLNSARERMDVVWQQSIFDLQLAKNSVDNIVSLFVIDDYPSEKKRVFFGQVFSFLKPQGHFFFAAYSPKDERMGTLREVIKAKAKERDSLKVYLEDASFYENMLQECGFAIDKSEKINANGVLEVGRQVMRLKREFILIVARKLQNMGRNSV
jgi:ubiquinone/menaquinone biosynthesis C-methylase UbiE